MLINKLLWVGGLALVSELSVAEPLDCAQLREALDAWRHGSFRIERRMEVTIDEQLKARLVDDVSFERGRIAVTPRSRELLDPELDLDEEEGDPAHRFVMACDGVERLSGDRYRLRSRDGFERLTVHADQRGFNVEHWTRSQTIRLLWKKLRFVLDADYGPAQTP